MAESPNQASFLANFVALHRTRLVDAYEDDQEWASVRASYDVGALGDRNQELRACLGKVAALARSHAGDHSNLHNHLDQLVEETLREVEQAPSTGASAGLSAIFANATANVSWWKQRSTQVGATFTSNCRTCGAAQETALLFECEYCGDFLYGDLREEA